MTNLAFNFPRDTFLGFDQLFNTLQNTNMETVRGAGYPPYNVIKRDDGHFLIEIAVAGFKRDYAHRGISQRAFERSFTLADTLKVVGADIVDGMLVVILENNIPEEDKPQTINLGDLPKSAKKLLLG